MAGQRQQVQHQEAEGSHLELQAWGKDSELDIL